MSQKYYYTPKSSIEQEMILRYLMSKGIELVFDMDDEYNADDDFRKYPIIVYDEKDKDINLTSEILLGGINEVCETSQSFILKCLNNIPVQLNNDYKAILNEDGSVEVGCQHITKENITNFIKKYNQYNNK